VGIRQAGSFPVGRTLLATDWWYKIGGGDWVQFAELSPDIDTGVVDIFQASTPTTSQAFQLAFKPPVDAQGRALVSGHLLGDTRIVFYAA